MDNETKAMALRAIDGMKPLFPETKMDVIDARLEGDTLVVLCLDGRKLTFPAADFAGMPAHAGRPAPARAPTSRGKKKG